MAWCPKGFCGITNENKLVVAESMTESQAMEMGIGTAANSDPC